MRLRTSPTQRRQPQFLGQIAPIRVNRLDQFDLPFPLPVLDLLLTRDRGVHRPGEFEPDERFDAIAFGEAVETAVAVLDDALDQVRGDAGIERAVPRAGRDSDAGLEVGVHRVEASAVMDPGSRRTSQEPRPRVTRIGSDWRLPRASSCRTSSGIHAALGKLGIIANVTVIPLRQNGLIQFRKAKSRDKIKRLVSDVQDIAFSKSEFLVGSSKGSAVIDCRKSFRLLPSAILAFTAPGPVKLYRSRHPSVSISSLFANAPINWSCDRTCATARARSGLGSSAQAVNAKSDKSLAAVSTVRHRSKTCFSRSRDLVSR